VDVWRSYGIIKKALEGKINEKRPRSHSRQHWIDQVNEDLKNYAQGLTREAALIEIVGKSSRGSICVSRNVKA